jgi:predicted RNA methylase
MNLSSFTRRNLVRRLKELLDKFRGLDFLGIVESQDVGLDPKIVYHYSPSGNQFLARILRDLKIGSKDSIIDIGCGKGSAMRTMLEFPFAKVHGLELCPQTASIATRNFKLLKSRNVKIHVGDAANFTSYKDFTVFYFYNPFPASVMAPVIDTLIESTKELEQEIIIIYNNPTCSDIIENRGVFSRICVYPDEWRNGIFVYSNRAFQESRMAQV